MALLLSEYENFLQRSQSLALGPILLRFLHAAVACTLLSSLIIGAHAHSILGLAEELDYSHMDFPVFLGLLLLNTVLDNHEIMCQHYLQHINIPHFSITSWAKRVATHAFSIPALAALQIPAEKQHNLVIKSSTALGLSHEHVVETRNYHPSLLGPCHLQCEQCGDYLQQRRKLRDIWILEDNRIHKGQLASGQCHNPRCKTPHFPDRHRVRLNGRLCSIYSPQAQYLRVGGRVWASRELARTQTQLRYSAHMSTKGFAEYYNDRYHHPDFAMSDKHAWKLFVLHESLELCSINNMPFIVPSYSELHHITAAICDQFFSSDVKLIPGGMEHRCDNCVHPFWTQVAPNVPLNVNDGEGIAGAVSGVEMVLPVIYPRSLELINNGFTREMSTSIQHKRLIWLLLMVSAWVTDYVECDSVLTPLWTSSQRVIVSSMSFHTAICAGWRIATTRSRTIRQILELVIFLTIKQGGVLITHFIAATLSKATSVWFEIIKVVFMKEMVLRLLCPGSQMPSKLSGMMLVLRRTPRSKFPTTM